MGPMDLIRRETRGPQTLLRPWDSMVRDFDRMFDDFEQVLAPSRQRRLLQTFSPACDISERENHYLLSFDLPGLKRDEIDVEMIGNQLIVSGKRRYEHESDERGVRRIERHFGEFRRSFTLPEDAQADHVEADFDRGVLRVVVPKKEGAHRKRIRIAEGRGGFVKKLFSKVGLGGEEDEEVKSSRHKESGDQEPESPKDEKRKSRKVKVS